MQQVNLIERGQPRSPQGHALSLKMTQWEALLTGVNLLIQSSTVAVAIDLV